MAKSMADWRSKTVGKKIDLDNKSYDCVDVPKSWAEYLSGQPWTTSLSWGNAKDLWYNAPKTWARISRGQAKVGDVVCMDGTVGGGYGHTGVVLEVNGPNIVIAQQNTFTQQAVYLGTYNQNSSYIQGFLRPSWPFTVGAAPAMQGYQRTVGPKGVNYRKSAKASGELIETFASGDVLDFKGFVHGENIDGNDIWFVGRYSGGYSHSSGFTDTGTHDLVDLTEATKPLESYQRRVGNSVINYRKAPEIMPDNVIKTFDPGLVLDFDAWTHGAMVDGNDIWFRGKYTGGWSHSGGFTNQGVEGLTEVTLTTTPVPTDPTTPTTPTDTSLTNKVIDISAHNKVLNYDLVRASVRGVIAKAGHTGVSYKGVQPLNSDPTFAVNKQQFAEKLIGAYWYGYASLDPETEAKAFVETVGAVSANFTYWLDIEEFAGKTVDEVNAWCRKFMQTVDLLTNKVCGLYCNRSWYVSTLTADTKGVRPIWLAHYATPEMSNPVANQVAHQYTSSGTVPGMEGLIDLNAVTDAFFTPTVIKPTPGPVDPATPVEPTPVPGVPTDMIGKLFAKYQAVVVRAAWTFGQTFAGVFTAGLTVNVATDKKALFALVAAAFAAAFSAAKNILKTPPEADPSQPPVL